MKTLPSDIERGSMAIIAQELRVRGITLPPENAAVVMRCIHASADFDYAETLRFTPGAVEKALEALRSGTEIVTDTNMALAGISRPGLSMLGGTAYCFMAEPFIVEAAARNSTTRAVAAMDYAAEKHPDAILAVGNAPTALFRIAERIEAGLRPRLVIAAPVGFVNVVEAKERVFETCERYDVPAIAAMGRKGGSSIAAAICNALIYTATDMLDPKARGWS
jgi:precorrin-8X/cobalt-precorrin-8 methylmutase